MKGVIGRMKESIPGNTLHDRKFQIPKEYWDVLIVVKKTRESTNNR
jgi:DNA/RNA endonuclease G (NUC1)